MGDRAVAGKALSAVVRFWREEEAQDVVEYALLCAFVAFAGAAAMQVLPSAMGSTYQSWDTGVQAVWEPCEPGVNPPC